MAAGRPDERSARRVRRLGRAVLQRVDVRAGGLDGLDRLDLDLHGAPPLSVTVTCISSQSVPVRSARVIPVNRRLEVERGLPPVWGVRHGEAAGGPRSSEASFVLQQKGV